MNKQNYKIVITSEHKLFDLHLKETFKYKDLILLFVKRDFVSKYKQTILGPAWAIIQPLMTTIVFTIIFGNLADLTTADVAGDFVLPGFLFYMSGNICWGYFSGLFSATSSTFLSHASTMGKVYYPRLVAPVSTALSQLISFGIQFVMMIVFILFYAIKGGTSIRLTPMLLMLPLTILQMMVLGIGLGIIVSSFTTKYRDLVMLVGFCVSLWQYATPVAYGLQLVEEKLSHFWYTVYMLNPVTPIITTFRYAVFGFGYFNLIFYLISWGISIVVFFIGLLLFSKVERTFMDTI